MSKKVETSIHIANGGNHSPVNYRMAKKMLLTHPYTLGLLYHIVLTGSEDRKTYRKAVELLCKKLRAKGMPCRWKACYERDKFKRFHIHVFLLIEAKDAHPDTIIHYRKGHWFTEMLKGLGLSFKIAQPQDPMHKVAGKQVNYAYVPKKASPKLDDCLVWISYLTRVRSKAGIEGQIYTGSTNREPKPSLAAALPAAPAETFKPISEKLEVLPTPAAQSSSSVKGEVRTLVMANLASACSAVSDSYGPNGASTSANSCLSMARATDRATALPDASSITSSRLRERPAMVYVTRNFGIWKSETMQGGHHNSDRTDNSTHYEAATNWFNRVYTSEPSKLSHYLGSIGLTVSEPVGIIDPLTQVSQSRSQA